MGYGDGYDDDMLGYDVLGYDVLGAPVVVRPGGASRPMPRGMPGAMAQRLVQRGGLQPQGMMRSPLGTPLQQPPAWRGPQLAPGVMAPFEGLVPLQLLPDLNNGILTPAFPNIVFSAQPQKPFRGQRVVAVIGRSTGAAATVPVIRGGIYVGTDLQAASVGDQPLDMYAPTAFGVEQVFTPAGPGISVRVPVSSIAAVPAGESVAISLTILGRYIA